MSNDTTEGLSGKMRGRFYYSVAGTVEELISWAQGGMVNKYHGEAYL